MIASTATRSALSRSAVRSFGQRSALRAPPAPQTVVGATAASSPASSPVSSANTTTSPTSSSASSTPSAAPAMPFSVPETGINHAHGKARKVGDE